MAVGARGCGASRTAGGVYWTLGLSPNGIPIECFLRDPPLTLKELFPNPEDRFELPARGTKVIQDRNTGIWHIYDRIGQGVKDGKGYWNVSDFIEEVRFMGLSRKLSSHLDFGKLTRDSQIRLIHPRAYIVNREDYVRTRRCVLLERQAQLEERSLGKLFMPKTSVHIHNPAHDDFEPDSMCLSLVWEDIEGGEKIEGSDDPRAVLRRMPSFTHEGRRAPLVEDNPDWKPEYEPAFFAAFPCGALQLVSGGESDEETLERMKRAKGLKVEQVEE